MKRRLIFCLVVILGLVFTGCGLDDDDNYSLGKYWLSYGVIEGEGSDFIVKLDGGDRLFPSATAVPNFEVENGMRVLVNYTILGDASDNDSFEYYVKINWFEEILSKDVIELTEQNSDSIGNDPIVLHDLWVGGGFLNAHLSFDGGGVPHMINLVRVPSEDPNAPIQLELRHNRMEDEQHYWLKARVSFDLSSLQVEGQDSVNLVVKAKGYDEEYSVDFTYKYKTDE